jgi:hypothetical protein
MYTFTRAECRILKRLTTPAKIQDYLDRLPYNFELQGHTCLSPRLVMRYRTAHCVEGAFFAAAALRMHGHRPLVVDLTATPYDYDHVIAVFRVNRCWGAISKTNHAVLRYRDPVYATIHELVMSYFHEYTDDDGKKTLRSFSRPVDLRRFDRMHWMTDDQNIWSVYDKLFDVPHISIVDRKQVTKLRPATAFERSVTSTVEWKKKR